MWPRLSLSLYKRMGGAVSTLLDVFTYKLLIFPSLSHRNADCPQCKAYKPFGHILDLSFDDNVDVEKLKETLHETSRELKKYQNLHNETSLALAKSRAATEKEIYQLKGLVTKLRHDIVCHEMAQKKNRQKICALTEEICTIEASSEQTVTNLKAESDTLRDKLEKYSTELAMELSKNETTMETNKGAKPKNRPMIRIDLTNDKINDLEFRLQQTTDQLEKEISRNSQLEIENMKLKKLVTLLGIE